MPQEITAMVSHNGKLYISTNRRVYSLNAVTGYWELIAEIPVL